MPDARSIIFNFSLITVFYLTKAENKTKKNKHSPRVIVPEKDTILPKNAIFLQKF